MTHECKWTEDEDGNWWFGLRKIPMKTDNAASPEPFDETARPIWEILAEFAASVPPEAWASVKDDRDLVAEFMLRNSFATGHGETTVDFLKELDWQIKELRGRSVTSDLGKREAAPVAWMGVGVRTGKPVFARPGDFQPEECGPWTPLYVAPPAQPDVNAELVAALTELVDRNFTYYNGMVDGNVFAWASIERGRIALAKAKRAMLKDSRK